ncbi:YciI family protein [Lacisediminihabitans sp.]|jgi:hypothetical protein|uniref:YciI family protein n=1 Tax=Lacisediminihabitans sp. TaxID=2787631 RepID=UPI002F92F60F
MTRYLISFPSAAMDVPEEEIPDVARDAHAVIQEAKAAGVYIFSGGLDEDVEPVMVAGDGTVTDDTYPQSKELNGGFAIIDVPSREAALEWAARIAVACRCSQEVRQFQFDPLV